MLLLPLCVCACSYLAIRKVVDAADGDKAKWCVIDSLGKKTKAPHQQSKMPQADAVRLRLHGVACAAAAM